MVAGGQDHEVKYESGKTGASKSCAVPAHGRMAIEHWPRPVAAVRVSDFKRAPAGSLCP